jgi:hypothetical protein
VSTVFAKATQLDPNCAFNRARCEECRRRTGGAVISRRVLPGLRVERRRLCQPCRTALGFRIEMFDRTIMPNEGLG